MDPGLRRQPASPAESITSTCTRCTAPTRTTPLEESLAAFDEFVQAGKVGAVGTSTFTAAQLDELQRLAADRGWVRPASEQPPYRVLVPRHRAEVLPTCRRHGIGVLVWAPLNGGWLTGKYQHDDDVDPASRALREPDHFDPRDSAMRDDRPRAASIASARSPPMPASPSPSLALGFALANPDVTAVLLGPRTPEQLTELLDPMPVSLEPDVVAAIDEIVPPGTNVNPADAV